MVEESGVTAQGDLSIDRNQRGALTNYLRAYQEVGLQALKEVKFYRPASELQAYRGRLEEYFREHPPATAKEAMERIEQLTGVRRSPDRVRVFLKGLGMECRKVGMLPAKADPASQESFNQTV
jgi:transposase